MDKALQIERASHHAWFHHQGADGWITVAKKTENGFKQYHYKPDELADQLTEWLGEDVYFSQNTFYKPQRKIENIRQLRSLYIDLDFYLFNYEPSWVVGKIEHEYFGEFVPNPNIILFSGQGLVLIWLLDPAPYKTLPLWQSIQNHFLSVLSELGGDSKAVDAARVFRIDGSINSKNGAEVKAEYRHDHKYDLRQLQTDYLPELEYEVNPTKKKKAGRKKKVAQLFNTYTLHHARFLDLVKIVELRSYDMAGHREMICFLYRYWLCCFLEDPTEALNQTMLLNSEFTKPLPLNEVERATRSAEKAYNARNNEEANRIACEKGYLGAGYNISNAKLIDWLDISEAEQTHLQTIIGAAEKRIRKRVALEKMRRERGDMSRSEYLEKQSNVTDNKLWLLQQAMEKHPKAPNKEVAERLGVSIRRVQQLKKDL